MEDSSNKNKMLLSQKLRRMNSANTMNYLENNRRNSSKMARNMGRSVNEMRIMNFKAKRQFDLKKNEIVDIYKGEWVNVRGK